MKDVLSLVTFVLAALCFVVFVTTVKPDAMSAVAQPQSRRLAKRLHRGRAGAACTSLQQRQKPLSGSGNDRSRTARPEETAALRSCHQTNAEARNRLLIE